MLFDKLNQDMVEALKNHEKERLAVIRMTKGAIQLESINKKQAIDDDMVIQALNKQIKLRLDSLSEFEKAHRIDLIDPVQREIAILKAYLPPQLTEEEIIAIVDQVFLEVKPVGNADMGKVMKEVTPLVKGKCDMAFVNAKIKEKLMNLN